MPHETLLNTILDNISDAILTIDAKGIVHSMNKSVEVMFGYSPSELIGSNVNLLMGEPYHDLHDSYINNYLATGQTKVIGKSRQLQGLRKNGEVFDIELFIHDIGVDKEHRFLGIVRDISDLCHMEKVKSEFVSTVSHELRTPLTSIKGALGMINSGVLGELPEKAKRMIGIAHNNTERLILLVNDLLDVEKIQAGRIDLKIEKVNLTELVKESIIMNQTYAANLKVKIALEDSPENYFVEADASRLLQVMANLISNAAKYSPPLGVVHIKIESEEEHRVTVSVSDNGLGIPEEYWPKIFQKFSQLDASDRRQKGGTGLGLHITKAIIEHHGGMIDFVSGINQGTTFFFKLPLWQPPQPVLAVPVVQQPIKKMAGRILVLEDEPDIAQLLALMLKQQNFMVRVCHTAGQAKKELLTQSFDVMTVDIRLPDQDGLSLIKELRGNPATQNLPIIIVSAEANVAKQNNITSGLQVIDWIEKPIDQQRLFNSVKLSIQSIKKIPKILYIEDDADLSQIMETLLVDKMRMSSAKSVAEAKWLLSENDFDLIILDVGLPDGSGLEVLSLLQEHLPLVPVIIFSGERITAEVVNQVDAALIKSKVTNEELVNTIKNLLKVQ